MTPTATSTSAESNGTMVGVGEEREWEPLSTPDYAVLAFAGTWQVFALAVCVHLLVNRHWPPYVTKNVTLVIITGVSGALWFASMTVAWGYWNRKPGDFLAQCQFESFFSWSSLCLHAAAYILRPYRVWKLLVKHDGFMWRTEWQIFLITSLCLVPSAVAWFDTTEFDYNVNACSTDRISRAVGVFMNMVGLVIGVLLWCVCVRQLRGVRKQFNEYESLTWSLLVTSVMLVSYPVIITFVLANNNTFQRRLSLIYPVVTTYLMFWGPIHEPFSKKLIGDQDYLFTFTKGFSSLPTPAQLKASLAEQLSVDQLRAEFRKYIKTKIAQELIDFYQDSLDREEVEDFFERQAVTMRIIEQFIREGSKDQVNISQECREKVLQMDATDHTIFDDARSEVLRLMETNFHLEFSTSAGFKKLADAAEREAIELSLLRAEGVMPGPSPTENGQNQRPTPVPLISARGLQPVRRLASFSGGFFGSGSSGVTVQNPGNDGETFSRAVGSRLGVPAGLRGPSPLLSSSNSNHVRCFATGEQPPGSRRTQGGSSSGRNGSLRHPWSIRRCNSHTGVGGDIWSGFSNGGDGGAAAFGRSGDSAGTGPSSRSSSGLYRWRRRMSPRIGPLETSGSNNNMDTTGIDSTINNVTLSSESSTRRAQLYVEEGQGISRGTEEDEGDGHVVNTAGSNMSSWISANNQCREGSSSDGSFGRPIPTPWRRSLTSHGPAGKNRRSIAPKGSSMEDPLPVGVREPSAPLPGGILGIPRGVMGKTMSSPLRILPTRETPTSRPSSCSGKTLQRGDVDIAVSPSPNVATPRTLHPKKEDLGTPPTTPTIITRAASERLQRYPGRPERPQRQRNHAASQTTIVIADKIFRSAPAATTVSPVPDVQSPHTRESDDETCPTAATSPAAAAASESVAIVDDPHMDLDDLEDEDGLTVAQFYNRNSARSCYV